MKATYIPGGTTLSLSRELSVFGFRVGVLDFAASEIRKGRASTRHGQPIKLSSYWKKKNLYSLAPTFKRGGNQNKNTNQKRKQDKQTETKNHKNTNKTRARKYERWLLKLWLDFENVEITSWKLNTYPFKNGWLVQMILFLPKWGPLRRSTFIRSSFFG